MTAPSVTNSPRRLVRFAKSLLRGLLLGILLASLVGAAGYILAQRLNESLAGVMRKDASALSEAEAAAPTSNETRMGCWRVRGELTGLSAHWEFPCSVALGAVQKFPLELGWPEEGITLPAMEPGVPETSHQKVEAEMSALTAAKGKGALLYLPATRDGRGYYVAGWAAESTRGWTVGTYGTYPCSVQTPAGRVFFAEEFKPKPAARRVPRPQPVEEDTDEVEAGNPVGDEGPKPTPALELDFRKS